jgi:uncharacterized protein YjbI with pentapeptide repeats
MDIINESGFEAAWIVTQIDPPQCAFTALVKGTFQLRPNEIATRADEQLPLTGDVHVDGDPARPLRYPFDFAPFKPRADALLVGTCHAAGDRPVTAVQVSFHVGTISKTLIVQGDRFSIADEFWSGSGAPPPPVPFHSLPLTWEHAYGGSGFERNPLGKGYSAIERSDGTRIYKLPNIESPGRLMRSRHDRVEPAGFGPIPHAWPPRREMFGTINRHYLKERWPWYPHNFDAAFFNSAPEDQQLDGFFHGDEVLLAEHFHPNVPRYYSRLPGHRVRCFLEERVRSHRSLREITMRLDTLWVDMDAELLVLVWRGHVPVRSEKLLELEHFFVMREPLSQPPASAGEVRYQLYDALDRRDTDEALELEEEPEPEVVPEEELEESQADATEADQEAEMPTPPPAPPDLIAQEETADAKEIEPESLPSDDEDVLTIERVKQKLAARDSFAGCDLTGLVLSEADFSGLNLREAVFDHAMLLRANFANADLSGAVLTAANLCEANLNGATLVGADLTDAWLVHADLTDADLTAIEAPKACLRGAQMRRVRATEAVLCEADLSDADVSDANLAESDLCGARLHRTNFTRADLSDAAIENAWGRQLKATGALIHRLRGAKALLCEADFCEAIGEETVWEFAEMYGANFSRARLKEAEFSGAYLGEAVFDAAELKLSRFNDTHLRSARMRRCNLLEASLDQADLSNANLTESNLFAASLMDTIQENANFRGANLRRIKSRS